MQIDAASIPAASPGTFVILSAEFEHGRCSAVSLGARGKRAERVGAEAANELVECLSAGGAVDAWLADQLVLPLCFAEGRSEIAVGRITLHLFANAEVARRFLPVAIEIDGEPGAPGVMRIDGIGRPRFRDPDRSSP